MQEVSFKVETLTPLMLAGANQQEAELRAPSFRGVLRYWLRALLGGLYGSSALKQIREQEEAVFGSTKHGSPVIVRLREESLLQQENAAKWGFPGRRPVLCGQFSLTLSVHRPEHQDQLKKVIAALWLLGHFGGVGTRARRGLGNLAISPQGTYKVPVSFQPPTLAELQGFLTQGLQLIGQLYQPHFWPGTAQASFDALLPSDCKIWVLEPGKSHSDAYTAFSALNNPRNTLRWQPRRPSQRLACPLVLRVVRLDKGQYTGVGVLFQATTYYRIIKPWLRAHFPGRQEVKW